MLDRGKFINLFTGLCELFDKIPSEFLYNIYYEILKDYTFEQVNNAVTKCVKTHKYNSLPKPAEILECMPQMKIVDRPLLESSRFTFVPPKGEVKKLIDKILNKWNIKPSVLKKEG